VIALGKKFGGTVINGFVDILTSQLWEKEERIVDAQTV
jgi:hypothetical protein